MTSEFQFFLMTEETKAYGEIGPAKKKASKMSFALTQTLYSIGNPTIQKLAAAIVILTTPLSHFQFTPQN